MLHDNERKIPEFIVRFNDNSSPCLTSLWSRSSFTVRSKQLEINSEGGIRENVVKMISEQSQRIVLNSSAPPVDDDVEIIAASSIAGKHTVSISATRCQAYEPCCCSLQFGHDPVTDFSLFQY